MKRDENYVKRLEVGDNFRNQEGEACVVKAITQDGSIHAGTARDGYDRHYNEDGSGKTPVSKGIETP